MATVIQPSVWDLWWEIAIYHDNAKITKKEACILCGCGLFYVWSFLSEFTSWSQFALPRQGNETKGLTYSN